MDITLADLMHLEPRLSPGSDCTEAVQTATGLDLTEVSWAVTARATAPLLPALRGGELLLIPARVSAEIGEELPALLEQAKSRAVSAFVFADFDPALQRARVDFGASWPLQWQGELGTEAESSINRLLTECRGTMFRVGTELERALNELASRQTGSVELV